MNQKSTTEVPTKDPSQKKRPKTMKDADEIMQSLSASKDEAVTTVKSHHVVENVFTV